MQPAENLWHAWCPWLYQHVDVFQMDDACVSLDIDTSTDATRVLTATNTWPRQQDAAAGQAAAVHVLDVPTRKPAEPVDEFAEIGQPQYTAGVTLSAPILRARFLRKDASLAVVKLTDGVVLADLKKGTTHGSPVPLASKRPKVVGQKTTALACQGTLAVYTDFAYSQQNQDNESQNLYSWDVERQGRQRLLSVDGRIEDVCFAGCTPHTLYCVSDDGYFRVVDLRGKEGCVREEIAPSSMPMKSVSCSAEKGLVVSGGLNAMLLWDTRMTGKGHLMAFDHAGQRVVKTACHPTDGGIVASATADGRVWVWDVSLYGSRDRNEDALPPELVFIHSGHSPSVVSDLLWHPSLPHTLLSTDALAALHVYEPLVLHSTDEELKERTAVGITSPEGALK